MTGKRKRGDFGEEYTARQLMQRGYQIVARNFSKKCGEIDIVAKKDGVLAFVEVKTRGLFGYQRGALAVDANKQAKIILTAEKFLEDYADYDETRFDIAEVTITDSDDPDVVEFSYFEAAFCAN
ncbi:MAG: YraN family protein [Oscillospiraceae bacterium]|jgi:putative endonuclease|nr:YraN family protein [Oscillospiraceae bacterium]